MRKEDGLCALVDDQTTHLVFAMMYKLQQQNEVKPSEE
jgi:hypothetical protein